MDLEVKSLPKINTLGWIYWFPNPLFQFIWYLVGVPQTHPDLLVEEI